jgi:ABC-type amino acid transport substrate-binding protein
VIPWARAVKELETGEADAVSPAGYTAERAETLYYTEEEMAYTEGPLPLSAIMDSEVVFFARAMVKDSFSLETFDSFEDIRDADIRVGAIAGWRSTQRLHDAGVDVIEYIDIPSQFQGLAGGFVDIALQEKAVGFSALKRIESGEEIVLLDKVFFADPMYLSFSKISDYPNLLEIREQYLDEVRKIREGGEYEEIYARYVE